MPTSMRTLPLLIGTLLGLCWLAAALFAKPNGVEEAETIAPQHRAPPAARFGPGILERDPATRAAIRATAGVTLPAGHGGQLRLVADKTRYRLDLFEGETRVKVYPIAFGPRPWGAKQHQGDARTPEGEYLLIPHHESPAFGTCFYVCYPGPHDAQRGYLAGLIDRRSWREILLAAGRRELPPWDTRLGGLILLHGTRDRELTGLTGKNWTRGCLAMENADLLELLGAFAAQDRPSLRIQP